MIVTGMISRIKLPGKYSYWLDVDEVSYKFSEEDFNRSELDKLVGKSITAKVSLNNRKVLEIVN